MSAEPLVDLREKGVLEESPLAVECVQAAYRHAHLGSDGVGQVSQDLTQRALSLILQIEIERQEGIGGQKLLQIQEEGGLAYTTLTKENQGISSGIAQFPRHPLHEILPPKEAPLIKKRATHYVRINQLGHSQPFSNASRSALASSPMPLASQSGALRTVPTSQSHCC